MLIGKNVVLRPPTLADQAMRAEWINDPEFFGEFYNLWPTTREREEKAFAEPANAEERAMFFITRREGGEALGQIGYRNPFNYSGHGVREVWYTVHPRFRRQGVATRAACLLVNHLFDALPVNRLQATVVAGNEGSRRVLEQAGMTQEGVMRGILFLHGRYADMHLYSILRADWGDEAGYRAGRKEF